MAAAKALSMEPEGDSVTYHLILASAMATSLLAAGCRVGPQADRLAFMPLAATLSAAVASSEAVSPTPAPSTPSDGAGCWGCGDPPTGRVGDGRTEFPCPNPKCPALAKDVEPPTIEEVSDGPEWNWSGDNYPTLSEMRQHLISDHDIEPASANKMSAAECRALHDLLHNSETRSESSSSCPSGTCPTSGGSKSTTTQRRGLFGRWR